MIDKGLRALPGGAACAGAAAEAASAAAASHTVPIASGPRRARRPEQRDTGMILRLEDEGTHGLAWFDLSLPRKLPQPGSPGCPPRLSSKDGRRPRPVAAAAPRRYGRTGPAEE